MGIFKAYDIRGVYKKDLTEEISERIGQAVVQFLKAKRVCVGRDMRVSSPKLFAALTRGMMTKGAEVVDLGLISTPLLYFASTHLAGDGFVMVTASHNPSEYNGFKVMKPGGIGVAGDSGLKEIEKLASAAKPGNPKGKLKSYSDLKADYLEYVRGLIADFKPVRKIKVVVDAGNGMGHIEGIMLQQLHEQLDIEVVPLFFEPDGSFPNHEANPIKSENLKALKKAVVENKADFGIAYDGDADRIGLVDEEGIIVPADILLALFSEHYLKLHKGASVVYNIGSSMIVRETVEKAGGKAFVSPVGHTNVKAVMRKQKAVLGGEISGHIFYKEFSNFESTLYSAILLIIILNEKGGKLSRTLKHLRAYHKIEETNFEVADKDGMLLKVEKAFSKGAKVSHLDGVLLEYGDAWVGVRKSNTEPLIRVNIEAKSKKRLSELKRKVLSFIRENRR